MIKSSLILNILVLIPVCYGLIINAEWARHSFGIFSPARGILLSIYLSILIASVILYFKMDVKYIASLLFIQIVYKLTTPFTVGTTTNPIVISNLFIALFHSFTLFTIWKHGKL
jgi:hypothetical protein